MFEKHNKKKGYFLDFWDLTLQVEQKKINLDENCKDYFFSWCDALDQETPWNMTLVF